MCNIKEGVQRTFESGKTTRRMFYDGKIRINSVDKEKNYKVSLMLLNGLKNRNGWVYEGIEKNLSQFVDIPILCAWVRNKPDGHNFDIRVDPVTGEEYPSFIGADAEKIIGWINPETPDGQDNAYIENVDGVDWVCVREAFIPSHYNKEFIDALEKEGGQMRVSIETLVTKYRLEGDTEYEEEWSVVGVTVISVTEAVAGANIKKKVNAYSEELKELKLRVASYYAKDNNETQTQTKKMNKGETKMVINIDDLRDKFDGYTVIAVNGLNVALMNDQGRTFSYSFNENENETIATERIQKVGCNCIFGEGDGAVSVPVDTVVGYIKSQLNSVQKALDEKTMECTGIMAKLNTLMALETKRRKEAVKTAVREQLHENQNCGADIDDNLCNDLLTEEKVNAYAAMNNADGEFVGDVAARKDVDAMCMEKVRESMKTKNNKQFVWAIKDNTGTPEARSDVENILARYKNK